MKKWAMVVLGLVVMTAFLAPSHAFMRKDMALLKGKVVAFHDKEKQLEVEGEAGEGRISFNVTTADIITSVNRGDRVVVIYKIDGNVATIVKPVPPGR